MVSEILQEMNSATQGNPIDEHPPQMMQNDNSGMQLDQNAQIYAQQQSVHLNRQIDPNVNMSANDDFRKLTEEDNISPTIVVKTELSMKDKILEKIKEPLLVTAIMLLLNNPVFGSLLVRYLPKLFSAGVSTSVQYISILLKSLIAGILFFALKTIL